MEIIFLGQSLKLESKTEIIDLRVEGDFLCVGEMDFCVQVMINHKLKLRSKNAIFATFHLTMI